MSRILVVGSSNTDLTVSLPHLPGVGQTVLGGDLLTGFGGKGANQAVAARRAGAEVIFLTALGNDPYGRAFAAHLEAEGIATDHIQVIDSRSGVALILVGARGENMIAVAQGANARLQPSDVDRLPDALFQEGETLLVAGLEVPLEVVERAVERGHAAGMRVMLNPAPVLAGLARSSVFAKVGLITPNRVELGMLTGLDAGSETGLINACLRLQEMGPRQVVVTLGEAGCLIVDGELAPRFLAARAVEAVDSVAAGDAFNGALAVGLSEGRLLLEAAEWATAAAALAVMKRGAQSSLAQRAEIDAFAARS